MKGVNYMSKMSNKFMKQLYASLYLMYLRDELRYTEKMLDYIAIDRKKYIKYKTKRDNAEFERKSIDRKLMYYYQSERS